MNMSKSIRSFLLAFAVLAGFAGATAAPALADGWNHGRDVRAHAWHGHWLPAPRPPVVVAPVAAYGVYAYPPAPMAAITASVPFLDVTIR
jgi:hypothetical protein